MRCFLTARRIAVALAVVVAAALCGPAANAQSVPFRGSLAGVVTHTPVDAQTDAVLIEATGTATHLGQFALSVPHFVNTASKTAAGTYEFTAANGDTLSASFTGQAAPTDTPGVLAIGETATITGGTGRFAGATGSFTVERLYDRIAGTTVGSFAGTISAPGAARR
jgi:hypothetical protein